MRKKCECGHGMKLQLRMIIHAGNVKIKNVPVLTCSRCKSSVIYPDVKQDMTKLIRQLKRSSRHRKIDFKEINEFSRFIYTLSETDMLQIPPEALLEERINELLDLLLLAQSLKDSHWIRQISTRLKVLSSLAENVFDFS